MSAVETIVGKFIDQGGDPTNALLLRYAVVNAPPPVEVEFMLAHPETSLEVDRLAQRIAVYEQAGGLLCEAPLDVDMRAHLLGHVLERYEASGGADHFALAKWALADAPLEWLALTAKGLAEFVFVDGEAMVRPTDEGVREAERLEVAYSTARPNDACPCGSGRKFKRCCKDGA